MSDPIVQPVSELVPQPGPGLSQIQRVIYTFTAPSKTFNDIKAGNKSWWMPWLIGLLVTYLFFAAVYTKIGMQQVAENQIHLNPKQEAKLADAPPDQRALSMKITVGIYYVIFLGGPVIGPLFLALASLILWGTINFAFGGKANFSGIFAVWMYAGLPGLIKSLLGILIVLVSSTPESFNLSNPAPTNIAAFLNPIETNKAIYSLLTWMDATTLWSLVLLGIGTAIVAGVKRSSGFIAVFAWFAVIVIVSVGAAVAFS